MTDKPPPTITCQWCGVPCDPVPSVCPGCEMTLASYIDGNTTILQIRDRLKKGGEGSLFTMHLGPEGKVRFGFMTAATVAAAQAEIDAMQPQVSDGQIR